MPTAAALSGDGRMMRAPQALVDSGALKSNLAAVRRQAPGARVMAVVKANAYGHGLVGVGRALADADAFAVARIEEAVALREAGLGNRIVLLEGVFEPGQLPLASSLGLDVVIHSREQLEMLEAAALPRAVDTWLKIDTGMNRLGIRPEDVAEITQRLAGSPGVTGPPRLMTHLACADERDAGTTDRQLQRFTAAVSGQPGERSMANSAGLLWRPDSHADWVRPGIMLYGVSPFAGETGAGLGLRPAMQLLSRVIAVRHVRRGERVGYGGTWTAEADSRVAIAAIGYGDGYPRSLPSGTPVMVRDRRAPLAGRVSMDMIAVDVTGLPEVSIGDAVVLWGARLPVEELASLAGTIPYELLCGVTQRVGVTNV